MKKIYPLVPLIFLMIAGICPGCIPERNNYYLTPNHANSTPYHNIPLKSDSLTGANYLDAVYGFGTANDLGADQVFAIRLGAHRSNNFGSFQAFYGASLALGTYKIGEYYGYVQSGTVPFYPVDSLLIPGRRKFFGSYGFNGGINLVLPFRRGEWRAVGIETSVQREFGDYLSFRQKLADSIANVVFRKNATASLGLFTDIIGQTRHGTAFGFKISYGLILNSGSNYSQNSTAPNILPLYYISQTWHLTKGHVTGYVQINFGNYASSGQFGVNYRIGK